MLIELNKLIGLVGLKFVINQLINHKLVSISHKLSQINIFTLCLLLIAKQATRHIQKLV